MLEVIDKVILRINRQLFKVFLSFTYYAGLSYSR